MNVFPPVIDSTMLASYRNCPTSFNLGYLQHYRLGSGGESVHLVAGGAFAKACEMARRAFYVDGMSQQDAEAEGLIALVKAYGDFDPPEGSAKTLERMCGALEYYFESYPLATDIARVSKLGPNYAVEFSFATPLPFNHPVTGLPLIFAGKADAVVDYAGGLYILDEKTTTSLGSQWAKQWDLRAQFTAYAWGLKQLGFKPAGSIVRGISILKTKFETQQAIVGQEQWKIDRWEKEMHRTVAAMINDYKTQDFAYNLGAACAEYSGCPYRMVCLSPDPEPWLNTYYEKHEWHPLAQH
jgi:PD-(D/E)XK nuclease superfamily